MNKQDIPEEFQEAIEGLRHGNTTIETFVNQAIEDADNWEEAQSREKGVNHV